MSRLRRVYSADGRIHVVHVAQEDGSVRGDLDEEPFSLEARLIRPLRTGAELMVGTSAAPERAVVARDGDTVFVALRGRIHRLTVTTQHVDGDDAHEGGDELYAGSPMTGVVLKVLVEPGHAAAAGEPLFVVEAMKMEFVVEAPRDVVVESVDVAEGDRVDIGQALAHFAAEATEA